MQAIDHLLSGCDIRFCLGDLRLDTRWIEPRHDLPGFDVIALLNQYLRDALVGVEGKIRLAQVHVAVQDDLVRALVAIGQPPPQAAHRSYEHPGEQNPTGFRHRVSLPRL
jgi:hypothetical protein